MDQILSPPAKLDAAATAVPPVMSPVRRSWARRTALLGLLVFISTILFAILPSVRQATDVCGRRPDMTAFQLSRSVADLNVVFADIAPGCWTATAKAMDHMNRLDLPMYMIIYTAFMAAAALFESARLQQRRWLWGLLAAAVALLGDLLETGIQLQITDNLADPSAYVLPLIITTWIKWLALGSYAGLVAVLTLRQAPRRYSVGVINLIAAVFTLLALFMPHPFGSWMALTIGLGWLALWIDSLRAIFAKR
jgi:hypothetical protein